MQLLYIGSVNWERNMEKCFSWDNQWVIKTNTTKSLSLRVYLKYYMLLLCPNVIFKVRNMILPDTGELGGVEGRKLLSGCIV